MRKFKLIASALVIGALGLTGCGNDNKEDDKKEEHTHTFASEWSTSSKQHWHEATCEHKGQVYSGTASHVDGDGDGKCDVCHYQMSTPTPTPVVNSVSVVLADTNLVVGDEVTAKANVSVSGGAAKTVTWSSNDESVATVNSSGKITAKKAGSAVITATSTVDSTKFDSVTVTVVNPDWSSEDKALMQQYFGQVLPYFAGDFAWTDEYFDEYECISAEAEGNFALSVYNTLKASDGFVDKGSGQASDGTTVYLLSKPIDELNYLSFEIYFMSSYNITSVDVYMKQNAWTAEEKAMMQECFGQELPFFEGEFEWTDEYFDYYGCLSAVAYGDYAESSYNALKDLEGFTDLGSEVDPTDGITYYTLNQELVGNDSYYLQYSIFYLPNYDGTEVDVYIRPVVLTEWPAEKIAGYLEELGLEGEVPAFDVGEDGLYTASLEKLTDGTPCLYIVVSKDAEEGFPSAEDYIDALPEDWHVAVYGDEFVANPADRAFSLICYNDDYDEGFEIIVCEYMPDVTVNINEQYEFLEVSNTLALTYELGYDVDESKDIITFSSNNEEVATVDADGVVTAVAVGEALITAFVNGEEAGGTYVYVVEEIKTAWSDADKAEFDKLHEGLGATDDVAALFNKYLDVVEYDEEDGRVWIDSSYYSTDFTDYCLGLLDDGWERVGGEFADLLYAFGMPYLFEKVINVDGVDRYISLEAGCYLYDAESEEFYLDYEGYIEVSVFDENIYSYAEAVAAFEGILADLEIETTAKLPESEIPASHFQVAFNEADGYYVEESYISFLAFDCEASAEQLKAALEGEGWVVEIEHQDEETGEGYAIPACDNIYAISEDGLLMIEGILSDGELELDVYFAEEELPTATFDFVNNSFDWVKDTSVSGEVDGFSFEAVKGSGSSAPATKSDDAVFGELRLYDKNTLTISSENEIVSIEIVCNTCSHSKAGAELTCSSGSLVETDTGYIWTGSANEVTFTCVRVGTGDAGKQCHIETIIINGEGEGGGEETEYLQGVEELGVEVAAKYLNKSEAEVIVDYDYEGEGDLEVVDYSVYGFLYSEIEADITDNQEADVSKMQSALPSGAVVDSVNSYSEEGYYDLWYTYGDYSIGIYHDGDLATISIVPTEMLDIYFSYMYS